MAEEVATVERRVARLECEVESVQVTVQFMRITKPEPTRQYVSMGGAPALASIRSDPSINYGTNAHTTQDEKTEEGLPRGAPVHASSKTVQEIEKEHPDLIVAEMRSHLNRL